MKTDEAIEQERAALADLIGPTRAGWYAEACNVENPPDLTEGNELLWACRYREMAREAGRLVELLRLGYHLSTYAASTKRTGNTPEFMAGLVERIELFQRAAIESAYVEAPPAGEGAVGR